MMLDVILLRGSAAFSTNGSLGTHGPYGYMLHGC